MEVHGRWCSTVPQVYNAYLDYLCNFSALLCHPAYYGLGVPRGRGEPVLLIPGFLEGDSALVPMARWLARIGYSSYLSGIYWNIGCPGGKLAQLRQRIAAISREHACRVTLVGHSLGGLHARALAISCPDLVDRIITLGSPAGLLQNKVSTHLQLGRIFVGSSGLCGAINCRCGRGEAFWAPAAASCSLISIFSRADDVVNWQACVNPEGDNYEVSGSHFSLLVSAKVYELVAGILAKQEP